MENIKVKLLVFLLWPVMVLLGAFLAAICAAVAVPLAVVVWVLIPFMTVRRNGRRNLSLTWG